MRVSLEWLSQYVDLKLDAEELADHLTNSGTEVEGIETLGEGLEDFKVGLILEVAPHPQAGRLSICKVDLGVATTEFVCGAPNVEPGIKVAVALPGTRLPDGSVIREATIRGVKSPGMILSEKELGISEEAAGIMILDEPAEIGMDLAGALSMPDRVLVLEITPNRPDCLSMVGIAREVAALTGQKLRMPPLQLEETSEAAAGLLRVDIKDPDLCSRYVGRLIFGLSIQESPWWMRRRLQASGVRPISNVVDITNYVMLELGQPLHAFDYDFVTGARIIVRRAGRGETLRTLDGVERKLDPENLLICDSAHAVALAGVMGGEDSEVNENTTRVLLESAHFDPANIMKTSRSQELSSEASYRFERGVDPNGCLWAADRAAQLMQQLAEGEVLAGAVDAHPRIIEPARLRLRLGRTARLIGIELASGEAKELLGSIDLGVEGPAPEGDDEILRVEVPTFRPDLEREIDLVEEVARLYGYGKVPATLPVTSHNVGSLTGEQKKLREIARIMAGAGLCEAITHAFISPRWLEILDPDRKYLEADLFKLRNPISEELSIMRPSLIPGLLEAVRFNFNRQITDVKFFEIGRVFLPDDDQKLPREPLKLACLISGDWLPKLWDREPETSDFFTMKGVMRTLLEALHIEKWELRPSEISFLHPAQNGRIMAGESEIGYLGALHPSVARQADLPEEIALMELDIASLLALSAEPRYVDIPRFPGVKIDMAVVVAEEVGCRRVGDAIMDAGGTLLREVRLFDLYRGDQVEAGYKSLAFNLTFYALDRTLKDEEVLAQREKIVETLVKRLGARLR